MKDLSLIVNIWAVLTYTMKKHNISWVFCVGLNYSGVLLGRSRAGK